MWLGYLLPTLGFAISSSIQGLETRGLRQKLGDWHDRGIPLKSFTNLVTFGDSYTDENRLNYFSTHDGRPPPVGTLLPISYSTAGGGITWPRWVSIYGNVSLYNYAVSGAVCSEAQISRNFAPINAPFPGVLEYEVPAFLADVAFVNSSTGTNTLFTHRRADNTIYAMWIGTNDLGNDALLTDSQKPGTNITTFTECIFVAFDRLYASGARHFVLMNTAPLQLSPLYGMPNAGGLAKSNFWPDKPANITAISQKMLEYTTTVNTVWSYKVPYERRIARRYPRASITIFDVHSLMTDIYDNPRQYLNGTNGQVNTTAAYHQCDITGSECTDAPGSLDGYMWYDGLHPGEQVDRVIAKEFVNVVDGSSQYAAYW